MSVRKREWTTFKGERKSGWLCDYVDQQGKRRMKTFAQKKAADAFEAQAKVEVRSGVHTPDSASVTVAEAGRFWLARDVGADGNRLERSTMAQRRQHFAHIEPILGAMKLSKVTLPVIEAFKDQLRDKGCSPAMIKIVVSSLGGIFGEAQRRGLTYRNPVREMPRTKRGKRGRAKLRVGVDIPTPDEVRTILGAVTGRWRPLLLTAVFTGLRASELRGLRWENIDLDKGEIHVRERADRYNEIGRPKSEAGDRTVPLPSMLVNTLKAWKLETGGKGLVFANGKGNVESLANIINRGLIPPQLEAGLTVPMLDKAGAPVLDTDGEARITGKYTGMHALRHFFASWCINPKSAGGLELSPKVVQERLGHSSIQMTLDVYGHLFPRGDDSAELAAAEAALLA